MHVFAITWSSIQFYEVKISNVCVYLVSVLYSLLKIFKASVDQLLLHTANLWPSNIKNIQHVCRMLLVAYSNSFRILLNKQCKKIQIMNSTMCFYDHIQRQDRKIGAKARENFSQDHLKCKKKIKNLQLHFLMLHFYLS